MGMWPADPLRLQALPVYTGFFLSCHSYLPMTKSYISSEDKLLEDLVALLKALIFRRGVSLGLGTRANTET